MNAPINEITMKLDFKAIAGLAVFGAILMTIGAALGAHFVSDRVEQIAKTGQFGIVRDGLYVRCEQVGSAEQPK